MLVVAQPIPFRSDPVIGGDQVLWIVLATVGLLALAFVVLVHLRRKGWLNAWSVGRPLPQAQVPPRWQVQSQRISRRTTVHTLSREGSALLVVESPNGVAVTALDTKPAVPSTEGGIADGTSQSE